MDAMLANEPRMSRARSILRSYAITNLMADESADAEMGRSFYRTASRWRTEQTKAGHLAGVGLFGAPNPKPFAAVEDIAVEVNTANPKSGP